MKICHCVLILWYSANRLLRISQPTGSSKIIFWQVSFHSVSNTTLSTEMTSFLTVLGVDAEVSQSISFFFSHALNLAIFCLMTGNILQRKRQQTARKAKSKIKQLMMIAISILGSIIYSSYKKSKVNYYLQNT